MESLAENSTELNVPIGTEEVQRLKPARVSIQGVNVLTSQKDGRQIVRIVCLVKHPDANELVKVSNVEYINPASKKVETAGLFINKDSEGKIRKNSALAILMTKLGASMPAELKGKNDVETLQGSSGYLVFKAY